MLHLPETKVRVIAPPMGGSFGSGLYNEDILVGFLAMELGRPVRWIEDRRENLVNARHARDMVHEAEVAFDDDGRIHAIRDRFLVDCGAYNPYAVTVSYNVASNLRCQYRIDHMDVEGICVLTNKLPNTPVRGAGRPEATFVMERLVDLVARDLGIDPVEVRRRNLIPAELMPYDMGMLYRDGHQLVYDSGNFPAQLEKALALIEYPAVRKWQSLQQGAGRRVGLGLACHVEGSGIGPFEGALVRVDESGHVVVHSGSNSHGQSHETVLAQVCADALGVRPDQITVRQGDSALVPFGGGTNASRSAVTAGSAVRESSRQVRQKVLAVAGEMLEVDPVDLDMTDGVIFPRGLKEMSVTLAEVAQAAAPGPGSQAPPGSKPGLEATSYYVPPAVTFASATHAALVEVDEETGIVRLLRYVVVDDCGRPLNPAIVNGQLHGGVAHGVGNGLFEEALYDEAGQFLNASFMDYLLPTASDLPFFEVAHDNHASPLNPLGVKGVGEGGTTSAPVAIANAVADALWPQDVRITEMPLTPARLRGLIEGSQPA
jgi:carbon-monoxide dehydrogenase large subunit